MKRIVIAGLSVAIAMFSNAALASTSSVVKGCTTGGSGDCLALVKAEIASFKGTPAERDRKIAALVAALVNASTGASNAGIAQGIAYAGKQSSDSQQRQTIASIANTVRYCMDPRGGCVTETASGGPQGQGNSSNVSNSNGKQNFASNPTSNSTPTVTPPAVTPPAVTPPEKTPETPTVSEPTEK